MNTGFSANNTEYQLFAGLNLVEIEEAFSRFSWQSNAFCEGEIVCLMGAPLRSLMILQQGTLSAELLDPNGKVLKIETLQAGATLAGPILFSDDACMPVQLRAGEDCVLRHLPRKEALMLLRRYPAVLQNFLTENGNKVVFLAEKIRLLRFATIREKIAVHFLELARRQEGSTIRLTYSLEGLADLFGVTRPALSRSLAGLIDEGCIARAGRGAYRVDLSSMQNLLEN